MSLTKNTNGREQVQPKTNIPFRQIKVTEPQMKCSEKHTHGRKQAQPAVNNNFTNIRRITPACVLDKTGGEWYNIICYPRLYIEVQA